MNRILMVLALAASGASWLGPARAQGDPARGAAAFRTCLPCHSLEPGRHATGPSLAGILGRRAGTVAGFDRYSAALKAAAIVWSADSLAAWLANPGALAPNNKMTFVVPDAQARADIIAYLEATGASEEGAKAAGLPVPRPARTDLESLGRASHVEAIRLCRDTYHVTLRNGVTLDFWERNLRFKTDSGEDGPAPGAPALIPGGMHGDRAYVVFTRPDEISAFIKPSC